jgi:hypothetical protein
MRKIIVFYLLIFLFSSCKDDFKKVESPSIEQTNNNVIEFPLERFNLLYKSLVASKSNNLVYLKQVPFDTSYLIHIIDEGFRVLGVCYLVLPDDHRDFEDFSDEKTQLLFFSGLSFKLDIQQWETIKKKTRFLISSFSDTTNNSPCFDCPSYSVFFGSEKRNSRNNEQRAIFEKYDSFVRDSLLQPLYIKRKRK